MRLNRYMQDLYCQGTDSNNWQMDMKMFICSSWGTQQLKNCVRWSMCATLHYCIISWPTFGQPQRNHIAQRKVCVSEKNTFYLNFRNPSVRSRQCKDPLGVNKCYCHGLKPRKKKHISHGSFVGKVRKGDHRVPEKEGWWVLNLKSENWK